MKCLIIITGLFAAIILGLLLCLYVAEISERIYYD